MTRKYNLSPLLKKEFVIRLKSDPTKYLHYNLKGPAPKAGDTATYLIKAQLQGACYWYYKNALAFLENANNPDLEMVSLSEAKRQAKT